MVSADVFVHEQALCESTEVGAGTRIWAFTHVMEGARVGSDCNVGGNVFLERGVVVGDRVTIKNGVQLWEGVEVGNDVFLGPNAVFTNDPRPRAFVKKDRPQLLATRIEPQATIGANATVLCGLTIGRAALVGAGAVVVGDVAAHALVVGAPARQVAWVCRCSERLDENLACRCGRRYRRADAGLEPVGEEDAA